MERSSLPAMVSSSKILLLTGLALCLLANMAMAQSTLNITLYAHEDDVGLDATITNSAVPAGNGSDTFGLIRTYANVLREGPSNTSNILGSQVGIVVIGKEGKDIYLSFTYYLNSNSTLRGSLAVHGYIDGYNPASREFPVVGGTGDFYAVTGIDRINEGVNPNENDIVNVHHITLYRPSWAPAF